MTARRRTLSSRSFVVCLILSIGARRVGGIASNFTSPTSPAYSESNEKFGESSEDLSEDEAPPDDATEPDSDREDPRDQTDLSKYSPPTTRVDFVPTKLYARVRRTHTIERLPREDASKSATNEEEILAAPRLREVVSKSKINTVYTEEGYEDAAYDHGGRVRDAEFREDYAKNVGDDEESENDERVGSHRRDAPVNPKDVAENEIERLEEDLEREYEESERRTESDVPKPAFSEGISEENSEEFEGESNAASRANIESASPEPAEYGKIFWDYLKSMERKNEAENSSRRQEEESIDAEARVGTTLPTTFPSNFHSPVTEFAESPTSEERKDAFPSSAAALYETWKRRDRFGNSDESGEFESFESRAPRSEELVDDHAPASVENVGGTTTTVVGPKKLSYTIIIRPSETTVTGRTRAACPCDRGDDETRRTVLGSLPREEPSREAANDRSNAKYSDGIIRGPPVPLARRQPVAYAGFPASDSRASQPSVSREIGSFAGDRYAPSKISYASNGQNPRGNRFRAYRKNPRLVPHPRTRLVPPYLANGREYSQYLGGAASGNRINEKFDGTTGATSWRPEIMRFYRSFERRMFGRRKRSVAAEEWSGEGSLAEEIKIRERRNVSGESDRSVGADDGRGEKSSGNNERRETSRDHEKLLGEAPRIVDRVIDGEIEARFKNDDEEMNYEKAERIEDRVPELNLAEIIEDEENDDGIIEKATRAKSSIDLDKYPFYDNSKVGRASALDYATDPREIPRKTRGGTEFYDSRDAYRVCDEVRPVLEGSIVLPEEEDGEDDSSVERERPRLRGLGSSLDCFRAKYFDDDPLDNPLFHEQRVGQPRLPEELDPRKLHLRIREEPSSEEDVRAIRRVTKRPKEKSARKEEGVGGPRRSGREVEAAPFYQRQLYEDVMSTIKNLAGMYERYDGAEGGVVDKIAPSNRVRGTLDEPSFHRYRLVPPYGTRRVSYVTRTRKESSPGEEGPEIGGYFGTVTVHKRSVRNEERRPSVLPDSERPAMRIIGNVPTANATNVNAMRIVYTILDRMTKPNPPVGGGTSTNPARKRRVKGSEEASSATEHERAVTPAKVLEATAEAGETSTMTMMTTSEPDGHRYLDEPNEMYKIQYSEIRGKRVDPKKLSDNNEAAERAEEIPSNSDRIVESTEKEPSFLELRQYLMSDPPGYTEASEKESSEASPEKPDEDFQHSEGHENRGNSGEDAEEDDEEEEESRERPPARATEDSEKEFERFASRPYSPFESFEDPKYEELGPRVSKPFFHHPSFSSVTNNRRREYSEDSASDESEEANSRYSFPWYRSRDDGHDDEESNEKIRRFEKYEYPWDRRERLARERRERAKERRRHERLYGFDEDEDASETNSRSVHPWERYGLPSTIHGREARARDNDETSSIARPRFSSRYKTNIARVDGEDDPVRASGADNRETKISMTKLSEESNATAPSSPSPFEKASRKSIRRKIVTPSTSDSTISRTSTTKKPFVRKRKKSVAANVTIDLPSGGGIARTISMKRRGRGSPMKPSSSTTSTTTERPATRTRFRKKNSVKSATIGGRVAEMRSTPAPKVKSVEHRSRFSKERIITKTSYPALNDSMYANDEDRIGASRPGHGSEAAGTRRIPNESVREVSIMTKETPDRVYRAKKINENGVTDTFVTVTSNNRTNSSLDRIEARRMLESLENSEEMADVDSFARDSRLLANLLTRLPPYEIHSTTLDEDARESDDFSEGSGGSLPDRYEKHPERRLYYYVQDS